MAYEIDFDRIWLSVESTNSRARHVCGKCGFERLPADDGDKRLVGVVGRKDVLAYCAKHLETT